MPRLVYGFVTAPIKPLLDSITLDGLTSDISFGGKTGRDNSKKLFGRIKFFGMLGSGMGTKFGGYLLARTGGSGGSEDFPLLFLFQSVLILPVLYVLWVFRNVVQNENEEKKKIQDKADKETCKEVNDAIPDQGLSSLLRGIYMDSDHLLFFITVFVMGISMGVNDTFTCK